jgi:hypothetical protein
MNRNTALRSLLPLSCALLFCLPFAHAEEALPEKEYRYPPELLPLAAGVGEVLLPRDAVLGPLNEISLLSAEKRRVLCRAQEFFQRLMDEEGAREIQEILDPFSSDSLLLTLAGEKEGISRIEEIRYGQIELLGSLKEKNRYARIDLRLFSAENAVTGDLILVYDGKEWLVSSVDAAFSRLTEKTKTVEDSSRQE